MPLVLVLDNCEHLVDACASMVVQLLSGCRGVRILVTSRQLLNVAGELAWRVPPLSLPGQHARLSTAEAIQSEAVRLFIDRARAVAPGFRLDESNVPAVADICRHLDGIPLAIEL